MTKPLNPAELISRLGELNATTSNVWHIDNGKLCKNFKFAGFGEAFGFMAEVALYAEKVDHHPEWQNVYDRVNVQLTTHDSRGITDKDFALAVVMERANRQRSS